MIADLAIRKLLGRQNILLRTVILPVVSFSSSWFHSAAKRHVKNVLAFIYWYKLLLRRIMNKFLLAVRSVTSDVWDEMKIAQFPRQNRLSKISIVKN